MSAYVAVIGNLALADRGRDPILQALNVDISAFLVHPRRAQAVNLRLSGWLWRGECSGSEGHDEREDSGWVHNVGDLVGVVEGQVLF